jgi:hypothetical protein
LILQNWQTFAENKPFSNISPKKFTKFAKNCQKKTTCCAIVTSNWNCSDE